MPSKNTRKSMPSSELTLVPKNLKNFYYWMYERQNIWYRRFVLNKERPWTENKILHEYNFTNVYRQLDKESQWLIKNVIKKEKDPKCMLWKIIVFRYFNKHELFEFIGKVPSLEDYDPKEFEKSVLAFKKKNGRVFTQAYMINPPKRKEDIEIGIERFYCKNIKYLFDNIDSIWKCYKESKRPEELDNKLRSLPCIAGFMSYEIYCDLTYTKWFKYKDNDFVNVGPGAKFGLELIFPNLFVNRKISRYIDKLYFLRDNADKFFKLYGFKFKYYNENDPKDYANGMRLGNRSIEHSLCEFSKYFKMLENVGKPRQKFVPKTKKL